ncbi:DUF2939 domain-containing protein [Trinickia terrae]|uniref:DUF2939 domain-containing protein n=1 Tax=Trinickia terrae TaxID=2571161 RepID=A0A4U1I9E3_9BURK|nr:DUF2939 domain-containing protein [Trinickia terrae]TKC90106.1 DUF2939 domain-containing protein [Trinickia terrae]
MSDPVRSTRRNPFVVAFAVVAAIAAIFVLGYAYVSPYVALAQMKHAADARDAQTLNEYVDYPALRGSLKEQVSQMLTRRIDEQKYNHPFAALGAMIGVALIDPLVDAYATPDGVAAILRGMPPRGNPGERPPELTADSAASNEASPQPAQAPAAPASNPASSPPAEPKTTTGYRGVNDFAVTYRHGANNARYSAILHRYGLFSWKLAAIDLNG